MRTFASVLLSILFVQVSAQRECATHAYNLLNKSAADTVERFVNQQSIKVTSGVAGRAGSNGTTTLIRIPVVVHLLYNTAAQNISDAQIRSGIAALNRDFRKQNKDTATTPERFKGAAADVEIEFHLATADPNGVATTGIVRKQTSVPAWTMDDKIKLSAQGGDDAWDSKRYLNIWLGNTRRLLGYATLPGGDEKKDGLVINITAFGTINTRAPYNLGRTAVHEAGHWLGLHHIWGDESCGDDKVGDTPKQGGYTAGCPNNFRSSCGNGSTGDMYMNYMDFTNDACMNLFTHGQKARMRSLFASGGPRHSLLTSTGLSEPWAKAPPPVPEDTVAKSAILQVHPNPVVQDMTLLFNVPENWPGSTFYLMSTTGVVIKKIMVTSGTCKLNIAHLQAGVYILQGEIYNKKINYKIVKL
jgi:hypothetical protein